MARIQILRGLLLVAQLVISASYSTETSARKLAHSGACEPPTVMMGMHDCVLPVNANISLSNTGVGGMTDVHVSVEIYANNHSSVAPAIWHHPKELISTIVRVILPEGFKICQMQNRILSTLQGGPQGVRGVTGAGGFRQELAVAKGRIITEVAPGVIERTGREIGQADPCQPLCMDRVFEMETFHTCDENDPSTPDGGDTDDCRPTSSREPSKPTLLTFTISNVQNPEKRVRNSATGVDGELKSSGQYGITQFGVQIYKKFIEVRNQQKIVRLTMRYYNNRINDRMLDHAVFPWFDRTSNVPVVLTENRLWSTSVSFESPFRSTDTSAVIRIKLNSAVPRDGFIRIVFPDSFVVSTMNVVSVEVWRRVVSTRLFRSLAEVKDGLYENRNDQTLHPLWCYDTQTSYCKSKRTQSSGNMYKIVDGKLFVMFQESGTESDLNPVQSERTYHFFHYEAGRTNLTMLVQRTPIARNSELMIIVKKIRTPERNESGKFIVLTGSENATSVLHDSREAASVPLEPRRVVSLDRRRSLNVLQAPSIMLSGRRNASIAGEFATINISFVSASDIPQGGSIKVKLPPAFSLCRHGTCIQGSSMVECKVENAKVIFLGGYDNAGQQTVSLGTVKHNKECSQAISESCARVCDDDDRVGFGEGSAEFIVDLLPNAGIGVAVPAGTQFVIEMKEVRMPSLSGQVGQAEITTFANARATGTLLDSVIFTPPFDVLPRNLPNTNIYIAPHNVEVSAKSEYTMLFHSAAGIPLGGFVEVEFPEGWEIAETGPVMIDAAISGVIKKASGIKIDLNPPVRKQQNAYQDKIIHIIQKSSLCDVQESFNSDRTQILPTTFKWTSPPAGGMYHSCQGPQSVGAESLKISEYTVTQILEAFTTSYNYQVLVEKVPTRPATGRTFAISMGSRQKDRCIGDPAEGNCIQAVCLDNPCQRRVRLGPFPMEFPAQSVVNMTIGGIINGPYAESTDYTSGSMQVATFTSTNSKIEEGSFQMCGETGVCNGDVMRKARTDVQVILDDKNAHAQGGFALLVKVVNPIRAMSAIQLTFARISDDQTFLQAQNMHEVSNLEPSQLSSRTDLSPWVTGSLIQSMKFLDVSLLPCTTTAGSVHELWCGRNSLNDADCKKRCDRTVYIQVHSELSKDSFLALQVDGDLRNPYRPGQCSGPCEGSLNSNSLLAKYTMDLMGPNHLSQMYNDAVQQNTITPGVIESASTAAVNETIGQYTNITFSFFARSGLKAYDKVVITIPDPFEFEDGKFPNSSATNPSDQAHFPTGNTRTLNIVDSIDGVNGLLGVSTIDGRKITLRRCSVSDQSLDIPITFAIGPLRNRGYGSVNYRGEEKPAGTFTVELFDYTNVLVEQASVASPPIRPAWLGVTAGVNTNKSASVAKLDLNFTLSKTMLAADEVFVFLPPGFSVLKNHVKATFLMQGLNGNTFEALPAADVELERVRDPITNMTERVVVRVAANAVLEAGRAIMLSIHNVFTPAAGVQSHHTYVLSTASYGCRAEAHQDKSWETDIPADLSTPALVTRPAWAPRVGNWPADLPAADAADHCFWIMETNYGGTLSVMEAADMSIGSPIDTGVDDFDLFPGPEIPTTDSSPAISGTPSPMTTDVMDPTPSPTPSAKPDPSPPACETIYVYVNRTVEVERIVQVEKVVEVSWEISRLSKLNASWGDPLYKHCSVNFTLQELRQRAKDFLPPKFKTGGLGKLMQPGLIETWMCMEGHDCSGHSPPQDGWFCWVLDERKASPVEVAPIQWVPWGHNCDLKLV